MNRIINFVEISIEKSKEILCYGFVRVYNILQRGIWVLPLVIMRGVSNLNDFQCRENGACK